MIPTVAISSFLVPLPNRACFPQPVHKSAHCTTRLYAKLHAYFDRHPSRCSFTLLWLSEKISLTRCSLPRGHTVSHEVLAVHGLNKLELLADVTHRPRDRSSIRLLVEDVAIQRAC
jgi:hypothetical protein